MFFTQKLAEKKWKVLNLSNIIIHLLPWLKTRVQRSLYSLSEKKTKTKRKNPTPSVTLHLLRLILQQLLVVLIWRGSLWPRFNGQRNTYRKGIKPAILIPLWKLALEMRSLASKRRAKRDTSIDNSYLYTKLLRLHSSSQPGQLPQGNPAGSALSKDQRLAMGSKIIRGHWLSFKCIICSNLTLTAQLCGWKFWLWNLTTCVQILFLLLTEVLGKLVQAFWALFSLSCRWDQSLTSECCRDD